MNPERVIKRRSFLILLWMTMLWAVLLLRLWWIQLISPHNFSKHRVHLIRNAERQRQQSIIIHSGRGDILDRNGYFFTGRDQYALILFPLAKLSLHDTNWVKQVAEIVGFPEQLLLQRITGQKEPIMLRDDRNQLVTLTEDQVRQVNKLNISGVIAQKVTERYRSEEVAKHLIGFTNQNPQLLKKEYEQEWQAGKMSLRTVIGAAGLERSFDRFLQGLEPTTLSYTVDGLGLPLRGLPVQITQQKNGFFPLSLVTTLDAGMQQKMERIADQMSMKKGSIVVLDAENSDVLAMVSRPNYDQTRVNLDGGAWQNRAVKQLPPGSVFKTVIAAAALAEGAVKPTDRFLCEGAYGKYGFSCWKQGGHGSVNLEQAFSQSCNIAFAQIAKRLGGQKIKQYANQLGLQMEVGWSFPELYKINNFRQFDSEDGGVVFSSDVSFDDEGVLIQSAIGQRDVRITPLQAANLMATLVRGGRPFQVRVVRDIIYYNQSNFFHFPVQPLATDGIDRWTAHKLRKLLRQVVTSGTGAVLNQLSWEVAGKSGTAQAFEQGLIRDHHWFVGYTPVDKPRYAIAVVVESQPTTSSHQGIRLFAQVVEGLVGLPTQSG